MKKQAKGNKFTYRCTRYINKGKNSCSPHYIAEQKVAEIILDDIRKYAILAKNDKDKLMKKLLKFNNLGNAKELADSKRKLHEATHKLEKITFSLKGVFKEKLAGNLSETMFKTLAVQYEKEHSELETRIQMLNKNIAALENTQEDSEKWVKLIERLDRETVFELAESIKVGQTEKVDGISYQEIKVKYRFIGVLEQEEQKNNSLAV